MPLLFRSCVLVHARFWVISWPRWRRRSHVTCIAMELRSPSSFERRLVRAVKGKMPRYCSVYRLVRSALAESGPTSDPRHVPGRPPSTGLDAASPLKCARRQSLPTPVMSTMAFVLQAAHRHPADSPQLVRRQSLTGRSPVTPAGSKRRHRPRCQHIVPRRSAAQSAVARLLRRRLLLSRRGRGRCAAMPLPRHGDAHLQRCKRAADRVSSPFRFTPSVASIARRRWLYGPRRPAAARRFAAAAAPIPAQR